MTNAMKYLMRLLIDAAKRRSSITYGEAARRLTEIGFNGITARNVGGLAGALMFEIRKKWPEKKGKYPPLNILLVQRRTRRPSGGAREFVEDYLDDRDLDSTKWPEVCKKIMTDVHDFKNWDQVYHYTFDEPLPIPKSLEGKEKDGIRHDRKGEGENHKNLRIWVRKNPGKIKKSYKDFITDTEVVLDSADRVDVVYYGRDVTVAIEVKSRDSNDEDLRRGVFQCIKYRAVMKAMDMPKVVALLVTQTDLPGDLKPLLRRHKIQHFKTP